jgi:hypothetical protein
MYSWITNIYYRKSRRTRIYATVANATVALWLMPQLQNTPTLILQQDESPAHFHREVRQYLNTVLPGRWIGRASGNDQPLML